MCIDIYSCLLKPSHETMSNNARATKIFAVCITLGMAAICQKPSYAHFDVHEALVQYTSRTLFDEF